MENQSFNVLWLTGMSGSGKSTLAMYLKNICKKKGIKVKIIDGDEVRNQDEKKLGFGYKDVLLNNLRIAEFCLNLKNQGYEIVIVPVISPYEDVRKKVKEILGPFLHLIYIKADIKSLKERDTKGLYSAADSGKIKGLIGYSEINPYNEPLHPSLTIETSNNIPIDKSMEIFFSYVKSNVLNFN